MIGLALRSLLFVPGSRPDRYAKALASDADVIAIDLEDAVAPSDKTAAREAALAYVADCGAGRRARFALRINAVTTAAGLADLVALAKATAPPSLVLIPKADDPRDADIVARVLGDAAIGLVPLVESVMGLRACFPLAAHPRVAALMLGGADLSAELGVEPGWEALLRARTEIAMACAAYGKLAIDVPHLKLDDPDDLAAELTRLKSIGIRAKACIHPKQVAAVNEAFTPSPAEIMTARAVVAASAGAAVAWVDGRFIEAPVVKRNERLLDLARRLERRASP